MVDSTARGAEPIHVGGVHNIYFSFQRAERLLLLSFSFLRLLPLSSPSTHGSLFSDALRGPPAVRELPGGGGALPHSGSDALLGPSERAPQQRRRAPQESNSDQVGGVTFWGFSFFMQNFSRNIWKRFFIFAEKFLQNILQKYFRIFVLQSFTEYFFYKTFFSKLLLYWM